MTSQVREYSTWGSRIYRWIARSVAIGAFMAAPSPLWLKVGFVALALNIEAMLQHLSADLGHKSVVLASTVYAIGKYVSTQNSRAVALLDKSVFENPGYKKEFELPFPAYEEFMNESFAGVLIEGKLNGDELNFNSLIWIEGASALLGGGIVWYLITRFSTL